MFGYLNPYRPELKVKYLEYHKKFYCSLCTQIGSEYGCKYRMFNSYDMTIFLYLFDCLRNSDKQELKIKCPLHIFMKRKSNISKEALEFSSFINMYWLYIKLLDNIRDEKHFWNKLQYNHISKNKKLNIIFDRRGDIISKMTPILNEFDISEKNATIGDFDKLSNQMGQLFGTVCYEYTLNSDYPNLSDKVYEIGFIFGKWIYIIDALDDYFKDLKKDNFNPIRYLYGYNPNDLEHFLNKIETMHKYMITRLTMALQCLPHCPQKDMLLNVSIFGMNNVLKKILKKRYKSKKEKECEDCDKCDEKKSNG